MFIKSIVKILALSVKGFEFRWNFIRFRLIGSKRRRLDDAIVPVLGPDAVRRPRAWGPGEHGLRERQLQRLAE